MNIEIIRAICSQLKGTTEDIKWEHHLVFSVGGKMYCMIGLDESPPTASFKVSDEEFEAMSRRSGFKPAPYMAKNKWVHTQDIGLTGKKEWERLLQAAYGLIRAKLPKKVQRELEG